MKSNVLCMLLRGYNKVHSAAGGFVHMSSKPLQAVPLHMMTALAWGHPPPPNLRNDQPWFPA